MNVESPTCVVAAANGTFNWVTTANVATNDDADCDSNVLLLNRAHLFSSTNVDIVGITPSSQYINGGGETVSYTISADLNNAGANGTHKVSVWTYYEDIIVEEVQTVSVKCSSCGGC